jgi:hypothetical protein
MATDSEKFIDRFAVVLDIDRFEVELILDIDRVSSGPESELSAFESDLGQPGRGVPPRSSTWRSREELRASENEEEPVSGRSMDKTVRGMPSS